MEKETLLEACELLEKSTDSVYASDSRALPKLFESFELGGYFEDEAQRKEALMVLTSLVLFSLCKAAMWGDLRDQPSDEVFILGEYLNSYVVSDALLQVCQALPTTTMDSESMESLEGTYWNRLGLICTPPRAQAWIRAAELLRQALQDPVIAQNPETCKYLALMLEHTEQATPGMDLRKALEPLFQKARSESARHARGERTKNKKNPLRDKALELYDAKKWPSVREAARKIFSEVQAYAKTMGDSLSEDRFSQTLHEWIKQRKTKKSENSAGI